jgi:hypothetical protein
MYKHLLNIGVAAGLLSISTSAFAGQPTAYDFFPMDSDNVWIFHTVESKTDHRLDTVEVESSVYAGSGWYASSLAGLFGGAIPVWDHVNRASMWTHDGSAWSQFLDFGTYVGDSWSMRTGPCNAYDVEFINGADAETPSGTFVAPKTFNFDFTPDANVKCAWAPIQQVAFAQDVGLVSIERATSTSDLLFSRVDGVVVAAGAGETRYDAAGVGYSMALVADEITQPHPIYCFTTPCPQPVETLRLALILENLTDHTVVRSYANGQAFDVDVFDVDAKSDPNVTSWSDGQLFTQATWELTLEPGEREVYFVELPLVATKGPSEGANLVGEYQVVSYLTGVDQDGIGASKLSTTIQVHAAQ